MQRLIDLSTGETLIKDIANDTTYDEVLFSQDEGYDLESDVVSINGEMRYVEDLFLINDDWKHYRVLPEYEELWFGRMLLAYPLIMEDIEEYARDSGEDLDKLMTQVEEL